MKKITLIILMLAVTSSVVLWAQDGYGYYNRNNEYDNFAYADYEFRHSNAAFHIDRYRGNIYYFHHYRANVYFVLVGPNVFVVPALTFRHYMNRPNFHWSSRNDFIALSAVNFPYYDSYVRFGYYFSYYDNNPWSIGNHVHVTRNYRNYYTGRHKNSRYYRNMSQVNARRTGEMKRVSHHSQNRYRQPERANRSYTTNRNSRVQEYRVKSRNQYRNYESAQRFRKSMGHSSGRSSGLSTGYSSGSYRNPGTGVGNGRYLSSDKSRTASSGKH